ncbi:MAG: hypothetical protein MOGMAGMI_00282 [Candidatus Omnitrophica bacterium]|nr:hypothetical protein [Candidatus Omnitrophota bacterium]
MTEIKISLIADKLQKRLENISTQLESELNQAIGDLAKVAYGNLIAQVQASKMNPKNRSDYLRGLSFEALNEHEFVITLNGEWANKLESGFPSYDMKERMLSSDKIVQVGSRAGQPWVQQGVNGKFAHIPLQKRPSTPQKGDLASELHALKAKNSQGRLQRLTKIFKDELGRPISGKVATISDQDSQLRGLTKYQNVSDKGAVSSIYMMYRTISEKSLGWKHPGFEGHHFFDKIKNEIESELESILKNLL